MKRVIVTGANGFIGSSLVKKLIDNNIEVLAIDRAFTYSRLPESPLIHKIEADIENTDNMLSVLPSLEYDAFYHLAWRGVNGADKANPTVQLSNVQMAINCADLAKRINCSKFLVAGTIAEQSVKSLPNIEKTSGGMMYGVVKHCTHLILESYCKNIGLDLVWMQFSNIYGVGNRTGNLVSYTLNELLSGKDATFGPGEQPYDFIYVDDLIEAIYRLGVSKTNHTSYFIGSGQPRLLKDYLIRIGELLGLKDKICLGVRPDDGIKYDYSMFDTSMLKADIGEYISTTFDEGIIKTIDWLKSL